jgi:hypothetical protein
MEVFRRKDKERLCFLEIEGIISYEAKIYEGNHEEDTC